MTRSITKARPAAHDIAPVFAALGDPTRLRIVTRLCSEGPLSITALSESAPVTRQAITKHLRALSDAGLLRDEWVGRERRWAFEPRRLEQARQCLDQISAQWDAALERLQAHLDRE